MTGSWALLAIGWECVWARTRYCGSAAPFFLLHEPLINFHRNEWGTITEAVFRFSVKDLASVQIVLRCGQFSRSFYVNTAIDNYVSEIWKNMCSLQLSGFPSNKWQTWTLISSPAVWLQQFPLLAIQSQFTSMQLKYSLIHIYSTVKCKGLYFM